MNTPTLLTHFETCDRKGFWSRTRERAKVDDGALLQRAIGAGVLEGRRLDWGEAAGEAAYGMGVEPGLETSHYDVHAEVVHLACLADAIATAVRKPGERPWQIPEPIEMKNGLRWQPNAYLDPKGIELRRLVLCSAWNNDRHYSEARSWFSLGEVCLYGLPMKQVVIVLGQKKHGKRYSPWAKGLRHPANKKLRFRKKNDVTKGFKDTWIEAWREDYDEISTQEWLQAMLDDGVLQDVCFTVQIAVPAAEARKRIVEMAARKLERLAALTKTPDPQLTGCDWPAPCVFRVPCHAGREPQKGMFTVLD
jgi:hypothetical protein